MFKDGKLYEPHNVAQAREQKVAMIVQEMGTISNIGVAANIFLGEIERFTKFGRVDRKRMYAEAAESYVQEYFDNGCLHGCADGVVGHVELALAQLCNCLRAQESVH